MRKSPEHSFGRHDGALFNSLLGNCFDNTPLESFQGTLKNELVNHHGFKTRERAKCAVGEYIELFHNRQHTQARLDYLAPVAFTQR
jgi:putative transposase